MNWEQRMLAFRGGRKYEEISLCGEYHRLPLAFGIRGILEADDGAIQQLESLARSSQALSEQYQLMSGPSILDEREDARAERYVRRIKRDIEEFLASCDDPVFYKMLLLLPVMEAYIQSYDVSERVLPSARRAEEIRIKLLTEKSVDRSEMAAFEQAQQAVGKQAAEATTWASWAALLLGETDICLWVMVAHYLFDPEYGYGKRLFLCVEEWKRLKEELGWIIVSGHGEYSEKLRNLVIGPRKISGDSAFSVPAENATKYGDVYSITSLTELVLTEMDLLEKIDRPVRKCELCGRLFVPYQKGAEYCQRPNADYNNKSCARVGSRLKFEQTHKQYETPYGKTYRKNYKAYSKWVNENRRFLEQVIAAQQKEREADKRAFRLAVSNEMSDQMSKWDKNAKDALEKWYRGELSAEECEAAIRLPPIEQRSGMIRELRELYHRLG